MSAVDRRSPPAFGRPVVAEIDIAAYEANVAALCRIIAPARLCAVVKADAYGHGALDIAPAALRAGADVLAVAFVDEAVALRDAGVEGRILVLMEPEPSGLDAVLELALELTVYRPSTLEALAERAEELDRHARVHLKLDTGMHRLGAGYEQLVAMAVWTTGHPFLELEGLSTHFAVADEPDNPFTARQLAALLNAAAELRQRGVSPRTLHAANSAGALGAPDSRLDMVRVGLASYGLLPSRALASALGGETLRPVMRLVSRVHLVRHLAAGERLGYGLRFELANDGIVGIVPVGYADGVARALSVAGGEVLIGGRRRPIAGTISMDQLVVDLGNDNTVRSGDEVVLLGCQGEEEIGADEWADRLGTINYEVLTGIGARVPRQVRERS